MSQYTIVVTCFVAVPCFRATLPAFAEETTIMPTLFVCTIAFIQAEFTLISAKQPNYAKRSRQKYIVHFN